MDAPTIPGRSPDRSRRRFLRLTDPATLAAFAGGLGMEEDDSNGETDETKTADQKDDSETDEGEEGPGDETDVDEGTVAGIEEHAIPLEGADPSLDLADLEPLADVFADVSIVGMGEATHGTREFFQLKHRLLRFLVTELDYRIFAWEANFSETLAIDEYVRTGEGDLNDAFEGIRFWTWDTEEVLAMIEWLRDFNDGRDPDDQVRFYGVDAQFTWGPATALIEFLSDTDPDFLEEVRETLDLLVNAGLSRSYEWEPDERDEYERCAEATENVITTLEERFEIDGTTYATKTSDREVQLAIQHLRTLEQAAKLIDTQVRERTFDEEPAVSGIQIREEHMAENASWVLEYEEANEMALWAHNNHVKRGEITADNDAMGEHLDREFGDRYYPLGFDFGHGSFQAVGGGGVGIGEHTIDEPAPDTASAVFNATDLGIFVLDFETAMTDPAVRDWAAEHQSIKTIGAVYSTDVYRRYDLPAAFDGLVFVEETNGTALL